MADTQWPPRSPRSALLSSPSGRRKLAAVQPNLSPSKRTDAPPTPSFRERIQNLSESSASKKDPSKDMTFEDDDDEEVLQLQLQAIEARLKLKRLQRTKAQDASDIEPMQNAKRRRIEPRPPEKRNDITSRLESRTLHRREENIQKHQSQRETQIPLSPPPRRLPSPKSPGRVLLGIDKGLRGQDVSLKRAPSAKAANLHDGPRERMLHKSKSTPSLTSTNPRSFNDRIAEMRSAERIREERLEKSRLARSSGFHVDKNEIESLRATVKASADVKTASHLRQDYEFSRDEVLKSVSDANWRSASQSSNGSRTLTRRSDQLLSSQVSRAPARAPKSSLPSERSDASATKNTDPTLFDSYSGVHLSARSLPHNFLARQFSDKATMTLPELLKVVKSPDYDPPDVDTDWILLATIASKSAPKDHKEEASKTDAEKKKSDSRGKFMALTLTDLKWEVTLFLFGSAFDRFWKMTTGTVIAILNPSIMAPSSRQTDTGKFSLTLNSDEDTILEIGKARDLGWCKTIKRNGEPCAQWVDLRHTEFCEFHVDAQLKKTKSGRMEVNTMSAPHAPRSSRGTGSSRWRGGGQHGPLRDNTSGLKREGQQYDSSTSSSYWMAPGGNRSAASLLDEDNGPDMFHRGVNKDERLRRRLVEQERERDIARQLGNVDDNIGSEYLRTKHTQKDRQGGQESDTKKGANGTGAESLRIRASSATDVSLSPVKRRAGRNASGLQDAIGWGGAGKRGLLDSQAEEPKKKKTRFVTAKGIREAGRESLGGDGALDNKNDDDDELEIVGGKA